MEGVPQGIHSPGIRRRRSTFLTGKFFGVAVRVYLESDESSRQAEHVAYHRGGKNSDDRAPSHPVGEFRSAVTAAGPQHLCSGDVNRSWELYPTARLARPSWCNQHTLTL